jgi:ubiquinone/menaquinone biosynthesis C-methylase UbiE
LSRPRKLRQEYESTRRAAHYRDDRWTRSRRARRTNAKELAIVGAFVEGCGTLDDVLDMPCGSGRFRELLRRSATRLWSADASLEMLRAAPTGSQLQASAHALPLVGDAVDLILCSRLLHHFEHGIERAAVLDELARVSRRWVILSYFDAACLQAWRNRLRGRFRGRFPVARRSFAAEVAAAGLVERRRRYIRRGFSEQVWVLLEVQA